MAGVADRYGVFAGVFDEYLACVVSGQEEITNTQQVLGQGVIVRWELAKVDQAPVGCDPEQAALAG